MELGDQRGGVLGPGLWPAIPCCDVPHSITALGHKEMPAAVTCSYVSPNLRLLGSFGRF